MSYELLHHRFSDSPVIVFPRDMDRWWRDPWRNVLADVQIRFLSKTTVLRQAVEGVAFCRDAIGWTMIGCAELRRLIEMRSEPVLVIGGLNNASVYTTQSADSGGASVTILPS